MIQTSQLLRSIRRMRNHAPTLRSPPHRVAKAHPAPHGWPWQSAITSTSAVAWPARVSLHTSIQGAAPGTPSATPSSARLSLQRRSDRAAGRWPLLAQTSRTQPLPREGLRRGQLRWPGWPTPSAANLEAAVPLRYARCFILPTAHNLNTSLMPASSSLLRPQCTP